MLPGFSGHLVSEAYLDTWRADAAAGDRSLEQIRRDLLKWWTRSADLGPASAPRALLQSRAAPLLAALGFEPPVDIMAIDTSMVATVPCNQRHECRGQPVVLV